MNKYFLRLIVLGIIIDILDKLGNINILANGSGWFLAFCFEMELRNLDERMENTYISYKAAKDFKRMARGDLYNK